MFKSLVAFTVASWISMLIGIFWTLNTFRAWQRREGRTSVSMRGSVGFDLPWVKEAVRNQEWGVLLPVGVTFLSFLGAFYGLFAVIAWLAWRDGNQVAAYLLGGAALYATVRMVWGVVRSGR